MDFLQVSAKLEKAGRMECGCRHELISLKDVRTWQESIQGKARLVNIWIQEKIEVL